jgi:iron-sulfur cluster assembly accessory protein
MWAHGLSRVAGVAAGPYLEAKSNRKVIAMHAAAPNDIRITDNAARRIGQILADEPSGAMLRISVNGGGCSGFQYGFDIDRTRQPDDIVVEREGATVLVDETSLQFLKGSVVDFVDDLIGQSFKIENPQATSSCGCGTSFSL